MKRLIVVSLSLATGLSAAIQDPVRVAQGLVQGTDGSRAGVRVYRGIPYAAPPVGDMRWKPPQPAASWQGVLKAAEFGSACMQTPYPEGSIYRQQLPPLSEDCLSLNIWTAAVSRSDRRPVMVWIHGGAFTRGAGSIVTYDGENFARKGVVLVTINYRLGVFGFLAHPELTRESPHHSSNSYGLLDQIAALTWVKKNIGAFGGDANRVTIFGESAGSWAVNYLMASPLAKGLFQRAIGESGGAFAPMQTLAESEKAGAALGDGIGTLRGKTAENLLEAAKGIQVARPCVDGWVLPEEVYRIFAAGKQNDVPLIAGFNADEGTTLAPLPDNIDASKMAPVIRMRYKEMADELLKIYPADSDEKARASYYAAFRDQTFGWEMRTWVRMATETGRAPAYLYYFTRIPPGLDSEKLRAYHAAEIAYVFGNFSVRRPWEDVDRNLSEAISNYWVSFATTGNPNGKGPIKWPAYDRKTDTAIEFGDRIQLRKALNQAGLDFFDRYYEAQRAKNKAASSGGR